MRNYRFGIDDGWPPDTCDNIQLRDRMKVFFGALCVIHSDPGTLLPVPVLSVIRLQNLFGFWFASEREGRRSVAVKR